MITTKLGDDGSTTIIGGRRISKDHPRIEAMGEIDELIAALGIVLSGVNSLNLKTLICDIQVHLSNIIVEIATEIGKIERAIDEDEVKYLEDKIKDVETKTEHMCCEIISGTSSRFAAELNMARAITRRVERRVVALNAHYLNNEYVLVYLNRLSDLLFLLLKLSK